MPDQPRRRSDPAATRAAVALSPYICPKCGSEQVQALSLIHGAGTSTGRTFGGGFGMTGDGEIGAVQGAAFTSSQSALSQRAAPPEQKAISGLLGLAVLLLIGGVAIGSMTDRTLVGVVAGFAMFGLVAFLAFDGPVAYNREEWPRLMERWQRTFMCGRCGEFFEVDPRQLKGGR